MKKTYREGKIDQENALKNASSKKEKVVSIERDAKALLWQILGQ